MEFEIRSNSHLQYSMIKKMDREGLKSFNITFGVPYGKSYLYKVLKSHKRGENSLLAISNWRWSSIRFQGNFSF